MVTVLLYGVSLLCCELPLCDYKDHITLRGQKIISSFFSRNCSKIKKVKLLSQCSLKTILFYLKIYDHFDGTSQQLREREEINNYY